MWDFDWYQNRWPVNGVIALILHYSPNSVDLGAHYVNMVEDRPITSRQKCSLKNLVFSCIWPVAIFAEVTENECIIERHLHITDALLICVGACSMSESHTVLSIWLKWACQHYMVLVCRFKSVLSVCLSHSWSMPKRFTISKCLLHHTIQQC